MESLAYTVVTKQLLISQPHLIVQVAIKIQKLNLVSCPGGGRNSVKPLSVSIFLSFLSDLFHHIFPFPISSLAPESLLILHADHFSRPHLRLSLNFLYSYRQITGKNQTFMKTQIYPFFITAEKM